ncbi:formylglycine-generating enzyme family protein [Pseudomonas promysalinigenes]|uniref:formylglycine-generating enzyme family protein n=1 Tax=Pseudomonas promysalinigenes TaxID=485898 RepID=UPI002725FA43
MTFSDMVAIPGGALDMGSTRFYPEEAPLRRVVVEPFYMDRYAVTNRRFAEFVNATGYVSVAEVAPRQEDFPMADPALLQPGSLVFTMPKQAVDMNNPSGWWRFVFGACWRAPQGPGSAIDSIMDHPVVHIAYADAAAYATWAGKELPTEAEWELAARGGLVGCEYAWGDQLAPDGVMMANYWQGNFPYEDKAEDGYAGTSPVGMFSPNGLGLYDMIGNTWEWTSDWYADAAKLAQLPLKSCCGGTKFKHQAGSESGSYDVSMPAIKIPRKVIKGGSYLCAENYCQRYRPAARHPQMVDTGTTHLGFRCVIRNR